MDALERTGRMSDPGIVLDTFVSGLGEVEDLGGGCFRFTFYAKHRTETGGEELIVVAKLIAPMEVIPPALIMAAKAIGLSMALGGYFPKLGVN
jgi:hypothetical protein